MADKDGFKHVPNSGTSRADLERGFCKEDEERGFGIFGVGYGGYVGDVESFPFFDGGFAGRPMGWER